MALVFTHHGALYLVLDEENLDRIRHYDPFDFHQASTDGSFVIRVPLTVVVCFAKQSEQRMIADLMETPEALVAYLQRGYHELPSDHARGTPYAPLKGRRPKKD